LNKEGIMILHIIIDDKFTEIGVQTFERLHPGKNKSLLFSKSEEFRYLKRKPDILVSPHLWLLRPTLWASIRSADAVVIHYLTEISLVIPLIIPRRKKILWIGWGGDYYHHFEDKGYKLYGPHTEQAVQLFEPQLTWNQRVKKRIKHIIFNASIKRITFFSPVILDDFDLLGKFYPNSKMMYLPWNYGSPSSQSVELKDLPNLGPNILIGNSASYSNNHLELFEILKNVDLTGRKLIVPLSYGPTEYRDYVISKGKELFGRSFIPLTEFMPIHEYEKFLLSCSFVMMNQYRQQAVGNIVIMVRFGAKIFLSIKNPYYETCKRGEIEVYPIEEMLSNKERIFEPITENTKLNNKRNLSALYNDSLIEEETKTIIEALL